MVGESRCVRCGEQILWARSTGGMALQLDAAAVTHGDLILARPDGGEEAPLVYKLGPHDKPTGGALRYKRHMCKEEA